MMNMDMGSMDPNMKEVCEMLEAAKLDETQWKSLKSDLKGYLQKLNPNYREQDEDDAAPLMGARVVEEDE